ncbi:MAG: helix-turn-helix domain-containing protein [Gelidibacter sp.]
MRNIISFLLVFLISIPLWSQVVKDSLSHKSYNALSEFIDSQLERDSEVAKKIATYYIEKARKQNNKTEEFNGLAKYIQASIWSRDFDAFQNEHQLLLFIAEKNKLDKELMQAYYFHAQAYYYQAVWSKAMPLYYKSLDIAKKLDDIVFQHRILTQLGYLKSVTSDKNAGLLLQKEALKLLENTSLENTGLTLKEQQLMEMKSIYFVVISYVNLKEHDSAKVYNSRGLTINQKIKDSCMMRALYKQRSEIAILNNNFEEAIADLNLSKNYCLPLHKADSLAMSGIYGTAFLGLKQYDKAVDVLQKGVDDYNVSPLEEGYMQDHYKLLAKAYKYSGNLEKANFYFEKYIHTTDEFNRIQDTVASGFKKKEADAFLTELDAITTEKNKQQEYVLYIGFGATLVILVLLSLILSFYKHKKKNALKFQELMEKLNIAKENATAIVVDTRDEILEERTTSDVSDEVTQQILEGLQKLESQEYFLKQDCNAYNVAKKIKTNTSYLSKVVNSHFQKNFNTYINDLRINYAIVRLENDTRFRSFSIQSIAEDVGYKSADSFTKYFKQNTGLNPSFYIKQLGQLD